MTPRSVFITGASSGLGRGLALHYARAGATVHAVARREPELQALAAEAPKGSVAPVVLDVTDTERLVEAIHAAEAASGGALDLVIANAGVGIPANAAYCASKAALHVFMESVRVDLRGTGVRATTIYPGFVKTEMTAKNKFPMPFLMELEDAVRATARGIERGKATIAYPLPMAALARLLAAVPRSVYEPLAARSRMF